ncbi:MAG: hypothetical protein KatS3mg002_0729 [Candidatus Woesearchaeota archaeon]|nr:MAG: hypothetical protein KatS3mg002_0729 [Candidatus Woesearchaeota archaeon]
MATSINFKEISDKINIFIENTIKYFKNLTTDMIIAWSAIGIGLIILIIGLIIL